MAHTIITKPQARPLSLLEAKQHLRVEHDEDDDYIDGLIDMAIGHLEAVSGLKLITQSWREYFDHIPTGNIFRLAVAPVQAIAAINIYGADGYPVSIALAKAELDRISVPPRLYIADLPLPKKHFNGIEIESIAGFGDTAIDVPDGLRRALMLLIGHAYEFRGAVPIDQQPASEPQGFRTLIAPFLQVRL